MFVYMYVCVYVCVFYVCMYVYVCMCVHAHLRVSACAYGCVRMRVCE